MVATSVCTTLVRQRCAPRRSILAPAMGRCYGPVPGLSPLLQPGFGLDGNLNRGEFRRRLGVNYYNLK